MHIHTLRLDVPRSTTVFCDGCDIDLRLATRDESIFVHTTGLFLDNGPMVWENGVIVVPRDFSLFQEA